MTPSANEPRAWPRLLAAAVCWLVATFCAQVTFAHGYLIPLTLSLALSTTCLPLLWPLRARRWAPILLLPLALLALQGADSCRRLSYTLWQR